MMGNGRALDARNRRQRPFRGFGAVGGLCGSGGPESIREEPDVGADNPQWGQEHREGPRSLSGSRERGCRARKFMQRNLEAAGTPGG